MWFYSPIPITNFAKASDRNAFCAETLLVRYVTLCIAVQQGGETEGGGLSGSPQREVPETFPTPFPSPGKVRIQQTLRIICQPSMPSTLSVSREYMGFITSFGVGEIQQVLENYRVASKSRGSQPWMTQMFLDCNSYKSQASTAGGRGFWEL